MRTLITIFAIALLGLSVGVFVVRRQVAPYAPIVHNAVVPELLLERMPTETESTLMDLLSNKQWLVVFQNPYELRATGGFWGTVGLMTMGHGTIAKLTAQNVYDLDGPAEQRANELPLPPRPLQQYLRVLRWYLRDANWDPDFALSAARAIEFYQHQTKQPLPVDGVIAVNPQLLVDVLTATGPIDINGVHFRADTALDTIIEAVELSYRDRKTPFFNRKEILEHLVKELLKKLEVLPTQQLVALTRHIPEYQQQRVVQMFARDPYIQEKLSALGWTGSIIKSAGDYLMVVDSNLAAYKSDAVMERSTQYTIHVPAQGGRVLAELRLEYHHTKKVFDWKTTRYRTYTRVLVPFGSSLLGSTGTLKDDKLRNPKGESGVVDVAEYHGKTEFGFFISIEPGDTGVITLRYLLPADLSRQIRERGQYEISVQHQSGVRNRPLTVQLQSDTTPKPLTVVRRDGTTDESISVSFPK